MTIYDRVLTVLRSLNELGSCTVLELHRATGISRTATYRVVESLKRQGYVQQVPDDSRIRLTSEVRALSAGYREDDWIAEVGASAIAQLQKEVRWPTSLATPRRGFMIVRETTRYKSPFVFDEGTVGIRLPMLKSALGLAYLAFCSDVNRRIAISLLKRTADRTGETAKSAKDSIIETNRILKSVHQRGYAFRQGGLHPRTNSIAVPIVMDNDIVGSICVTFARSALSRERATAELLPRLRTAATTIASWSATRK
jgi:IclR family mhp operon transcriptional activator